MRTFAFGHAECIDDAIRTADTTGGSYYAGGTNLLDLMKQGVEAPEVLIDVGRLGLGTITPHGDGAVLIGSGATNTAIANHPLIRDSYPVLSQAILSGATTQLRNMATAGGNLLQRTRCPYYMDPALGACDKRSPGSGCGARTGFHREHALLGAGDACVAVHPSDMAVALVLLDAIVHVRGPAGARLVPLRDFYVTPAEDPRRDTVLERAELVVGIELPPSAFADHSRYLKVRDRRSYAFALVSVGVGLHIVDGVIGSAAIALGGVAAKPWRTSTAEASLIGRAPGLEAFRDAAELALAGARPLPQNRFKVDLCKHAVVRALTVASDVRPG